MGLVASWTAFYYLRWSAFIVPAESRAPNRFVSIFGLRWGKRLDIFVADDHLEDQ